MSDLTTLGDLIAILLSDATSLVFTPVQLEAAIRLSLFDYSLAIPFEKQAVIEVNAASTQVSLTGFASLLQVMGVRWPWEPTKELPNQLQNQVRAWDLVSDSGSAALTFYTRCDQVPQTGDHVRLFYASMHTIAGLAAACGGIAETATTVPGEHLSLIARGAAGYALLANTTNRDDVLPVETMRTTAEFWLENFRGCLADLTRLRAGDGAPILTWGRMDKWC